MLIDIEKIKVTDRIRKDFGDIQELADDIEENGLINPPVITPDTYELVAGERRLRAMKLLGYKQIEVRPMAVKDAEHQLNLEISENETRKDFSKKERIDYARRLERIESLKAKERIENGKSLDPSQNSDGGRTDDIVANKLNIGSRDTYRKEKFIVDNESTISPEDFSEWDEGKLSTNKAYLEIKEKLKQVECKQSEYIDKLKEKDDEISKLESRKPEQIETIIDNTDYTTLKMKEEELKTLNNKYLISQEKERILRERAEIFESDSEKYKKLKTEIEDMTKSKNDIGRQIDAITSISGFASKISTILKTELSPIKYSKALLEMKSEEIVTRNLSDIVYEVQKWCDEMRTYLPDVDKMNVIDMEGN